MVGLGDLRQVVAQKIWIVVGGGVRFGVAGTQPATDAPRGLRRTDAQIHALPGAKGLQATHRHSHNPPPQGGLSQGLARSMRRGMNFPETNYLPHCNGRASCGEYLVMDSLGATAAALEPLVEAGSESPPFDDFYWKLRRVIGTPRFLTAANAPLNPLEPARDAVARQLEDAQ